MSTTKCQICNKILSKKGYASHIKRVHNLNFKDYFDLYLKQENDGICNICHNETKFKNGQYHKLCISCRKTNKKIHCEICDKNFIIDGFPSHLLNIHKKLYKDYYDKYLKQPNEGICEKCGKEVKFYRGKYRRFCDVLCMQQSPITEQKRQQTILSKFGVTNYFKTEESKNNRKKHFNDLYDCDYYVQSKEFIQKSQKTCLERYGCVNPSQNPEIHSKQLKALGSKKQYILPSGKEILIRGYEPDFLDYVFQNKLLTEKDIQYETLQIKYTLNNKEHIYLPDFYIPKYNLIVEIKGSHLFRWHKEAIEVKQLACLSQGYHYLIIIDNDFSSLETLLKSY